jgi:hypothetical protein
VTSDPPASQRIAFPSQKLDERGLDLFEAADGPFLSRRVDPPVYQVNNLVGGCPV